MFEFVGGQRFMIPVYEHLLEVAKTAEPTPPQSNYYVRAAGVTEKGKFVAGGNHEYGKTNALHGEETVIARALEAAPGEKLIAIGFAENYEVTGPSSPCGNCRDIMKEYLAPDAVIIAASIKGGKAIVTPWKEYLKEDFAQTDTASRIERIALQRALRSGKKSYDLYGQENKYGAAIISGDHDITTGRVVLDVAYHATLPVRSAMVKLIDSDDKKRFDLKALVIASDKKFTIPYKDRQHFAELVSATNAYYGRADPITILITDGEKLFRTDSSQWLPFPFSPAHLGMVKELRASIERML